MKRLGGLAFWDTPQTTKLFQSFLRAGDLLVAIRDEDTLGGMVPVDNRLRMTWVMLELLDRFTISREREVMIEESLKQDVGPHSATELVVSLGLQNGIYGEEPDEDDPRYAPTVRRSFVRRIAKQVREKLRNETQSAKGDQLATHGDFMKIVVNWWRIGGKKDAREWLRGVTASDKMLVAMLLQQVSKTRMHGSNDRTAIESPVIDTMFLKNFVPLKECRNRCQSLLEDNPDWLDERGRIALKITLNSIQTNGKPIDHWAERIGKRPQKKKEKRISKNATSKSTESEDS